MDEIQIGEDITMPLTRVKQKGQVTIPANIRKEVSLAEGDYVEVTTDGKTVILTPQIVVDRARNYDDLPATARASIEKGMEDARNGNVSPPFDNEKDMTNWLDNS